MAKLLSSLAVGTKVKDVGSKYYGKDIVFTIIAKNHVGYPANSVTLITEKVITLKAYDAQEPKNYKEVRQEGGNNRYTRSNIRQWLNSDKSNWYVAQHSYDEPPNAAGVINGINPYANEQGFLTYLTSAFKNAILNSALTAGIAEFEGHNSIWPWESFTDKIFLLSGAEVGATYTTNSSPSKVDGSLIAYFDSDEKRKAFVTEEAVANTNYSPVKGNEPIGWWLRTADYYEPRCEYVLVVKQDGSSRNMATNRAYQGGTGVRPALNLLSSILVSDVPDTDGVYKIIWNTAPTTPPSLTAPTTVRGGETLSITWGASTDTDGNLSGYILERSVNGGAYTQVYKGANRSFTDSITKGWNTVAYRVKAYDSQGVESGYTTSATRTVINNTPPTISGTDSNLGDKNLGFVITYQVDDIDSSDSLIVTEKLNNSTLRTINGAPRKQNLEIEITNEVLFNLGLNSTNTIEIKVDDQQGGIAYRRYTFRRTNTAPIISDNDKDLGQKTEPFSIDFSVSDNEENKIIVKTYLDNVLKGEYVATDGATNTFTISSEDWYRLKIGQHSIKIEAIDEHGATAVRNYTFTRYDDKIQFTLKNPIETDIMATKILVTPTWTIATGTVAKVEACNNAFDEVPTWEDITSQVNISRHYNFTNDVKTATEWGIDIRFTIEKGTATEECIINGFGGAFE